MRLGVPGRPPPVVEHVEAQGVPGPDPDKARARARLDDLERRFRGIVADYRGADEALASKRQKHP